MEYLQAQHAASAALAGMALRQLLREAREADSDIVSLRFEATPSAEGGEVSVEWVDRSGHAVGGGSL